MVRFTVLITGESKDMGIYLCTTQIMTVFSEAFVVLIDLLIKSKPFKFFLSSHFRKHDFTEPSDSTFLKIPLLNHLTTKQKSNPEPAAKKGE